MYLISVLLPLLIGWVGLTLEQGVSNFSMHENYPKGLLKHRFSKSEMGPENWPIQQVSPNADPAGVQTVL